MPVTTQPRWMQAPPAQQDAQPKWMQAPPADAGPAKPPPGMVADPLSKSGFAPAPKPQQDPIAPRSQWGGGYKGALNSGKQTQPWNEGVADILQQGADFLLAPLEARDAGPNDLVGDAAKMFARGTAELPAAVFRDPNQAVKDYDPFHQLGYGYNNMVDAGGDAIEGNFNTAGAKAAEGANQLAMGAIGLAGVKTKPSVPTNALAVKPTLRETGKTLAATAVPGRDVRPQAMEAISRILVASNVPRDRVNAGMTKVIELIKQGNGFPAGGSVRAPTVAQLLEREFAEEFPEVAQNIRTVLLERRLSNKPKDSSPTIVRDAAQEMRETQVPFLRESASANLGDKSRAASRADVEANLRQIGEEGYAPIVYQRAEPQRARQIQDVLNGPGMNELGRPLRQIAAGEGVDIDVMIAQRPIEAAHWMQHKARLLAAENEGTALGNAYNNMRSRILKTIDDLETPDGQTYAQIRAKYGDEAGIKDALSAGDRFSAIVRNPDGANQFLAKFNEATPAQQAAQLASIRDWAESKLLGGGEEGAARLTDLQSIAVLETLEKLGAQGKALADDIRAVRDEERFLGGFYPRAESATAKNLLATGQGADLYSRPGASSLPVNALADGALMASGLAGAPILTAMRQGPKLYRGIMQPRTATREDMTRVLMSRPKLGERVLSSPTPTAGGAPRNALNVTSPPAPSSPPMNALAPPPAPQSPARAAAPPLVMPEAQQIGRWEGPVPQKPQSLLAWVRNQGGIKDNNYMTGDLKAIFGRSNAMPGLLNNQSGKGLDDIVAAAYHEGFDVDPDDANSLMRLIQEEAAGNPSYRIGAREEWDIYQEYLAAKRGDRSPEKAGFGFGGKSLPMDGARGSLIEADAIGRIASGKTVPTSAELDDALKGLREAEFADLVRQFGGDRQKAEKFRSLWRQAENAPTRQEADMLDAQRQKLIEGMPDVEPREFVDEYALRQLRDAFREIENGNAVKALNDSMTDLPTMREVQDGKISSRAQAALAILRKATQEARLQGLDPKQMMNSALENYRRRFSDPVDAEFMVGEVKKLFAAFDPSETQSSKLLAGVSGIMGLGTLSAGATLQRDETPKPKN